MDQKRNGHNNFVNLFLQNSFNVKLVGARRLEDMDTNNSELGEDISEIITIYIANDLSKAGIAEWVKITKKQAKALKLS